MSNTVTISCIVDTTNPASALGVEVWVNDNKFIDLDHVQTKQPILIEIPDAEAEHDLKFVLKNKTEKDTTVDEAGNIINDSTIKITDLSFDGIKLGHILTDLAVYTHNFNGTKELIQDRFYGEMGCNGTVSLKFTTPIYMWLLEHM